MARHENEWAGYVDFRQDIGRWLTFNAGVRVDYHTRVGIEWVPQAGLAFHLPYHIELKVSASKGFRYPILREMYMFRPKNPDLKAESMWNYEIAFSQCVLEGRLSYGLNLFYIDARNLILTLPSPTGSGMLNQNSGKLDNAGVEARIAWRINSLWSVDANYSYLYMKNPVVAVPEHKLYVGASLTEKRWSVSTGIQYVAGLYTSVSPEKQESFVLWNLRGQFKATRWLALWVRGENLLGQKYEINEGYPMPGVTVMGGLSLEF